MTRVEKKLVEVIKEKMERKGIEGDPKEQYTIEKKSSKNYEAYVRIGDNINAARGKNVKEAAKALLDEIK